MSLRKNGFQRPNISESIRENPARQDSGQAEWVTGLFFILILQILLYTQLQIASWQSTGMYLEDALAASNLASALIDVEEYGRSHKTLISDPVSAYGVYLNAVKENLGLDQQWESANKGLISGRVEIVDYVIYNVDQDIVSACRIDESGTVSERWTGVRGVERAPNGQLIEHTGVYSEIRFPVSGFPGVEIPAHKGKLVDILVERGEENEGG